MMVFFRIARLGRWFGCGVFVLALVTSFGSWARLQLNVSFERAIVGLLRNVALATRLLLEQLLGSLAPPLWTKPDCWGVEGFRWALAGAQIRLQLRDSRASLQRLSLVVESLLSQNGRTFPT